MVLKKKIIIKRFMWGSYMDREYATINELLSFLRKTYCSTIGVEYMHISDPVEKIWFQRKNGKKRKSIKFY